MRRDQVEEKIFQFLKKLDELRFDMNELAEEMMAYVEDIYVPDTNSYYATSQQERRDFYDEVGWSLQQVSYDINNAVNDLCSWLDIDSIELVDYDTLRKLRKGTK